MLSSRRGTLHQRVKSCRLGISKQQLESQQQPRQVVEVGHLVMASEYVHNNCTQFRPGQKGIGGLQCHYRGAQA